MRIAQVAPLYEPVPPRGYGGTERMVSYLTEDLVAAGHDVTLFASGDSTTAAHLEKVCPAGLRLDGALDSVSPHILAMERVYGRAEEFDVIHVHTGPFHFPSARRCATPTVTTLHGRMDVPELEPLFGEFADMPLVSISDAQRRPMPWAHWVSTIYHGLPTDLYPYQSGGRRGDYLAFLGRASPEKGLDDAVQIARLAGLPLKVAGKVDPADAAYFETHLQPLLEGDDVEFLGEVDEAGKARLLSEAHAVLFPIRWPEPFGLVMIEAMACGTPVIAYSNGSVPEVVDHGVTGFIATTVAEAVAAVRRVDGLDRDRVRAVFEQRFSSKRMAADYVGLYQQLADGVFDMQRMQPEILSR